LSCLTSQRICSRYGVKAVFEQKSKTGRYISVWPDTIVGPGCHAEAASRIRPLVGSHPRLRLLCSQVEKSPTHIFTADGPIMRTSGKWAVTDRLTWYNAL
jgi:hypothetical protein